VVVILDEVQKIVVEHGLEAERQLRSTVQGHRQVGYIFAGSATRLLKEMTSNADRPFYRLGARLFLGPLPRDDFRAEMRRRFAATGMRADAATLEAILDRAADVPYNVQRLAHEVWELLREQGGREATPASVGAALERVVRREDPAYAQIWSALRKNQRVALRLVIEHGGESLYRAAVAQGAGITTPSLQTALAQLEQIDLIRAERGAGKTRWRLVDPFFSAWLELA
jgi:hypothetical protein